VPAIRGAGLSRATFSNLDDLVEPAETQLVAYLCPKGHKFSVRLFAEAEMIPLTWDCACGSKARTDETAAQEVIVKKRTGSPSKTPWEQLRERRSIAELEVLLEERLAILRNRVPEEAA
jgi:hypothetical protein